MPTIFERLDSSLQGNNLSVELSLQTDNLNTVVTTVTGLIEQPPQNLGNLTQALNELPLPKLQIDGKFATTLSQLETAIPKDLSTITGQLIAGFESLETTVESELTQVLDEVIQAVVAVYRLTQIDLRCEPNNASAFSGVMALTSFPQAAAIAEPPPTGIRAATAQLEPILSILERAPSPFNVETSLAWLHRSFTFRDRFLAQSLPIVDDLLDPLETLLNWQSMTPAQIQADMGQSLTDLKDFIRATVPQVLADEVGEVAATAPNLQATALAQIADDLTVSLTQLGTSVKSGNLSGTGGAIATLNARLDEYDSLRPQLQANLLNSLPALGQRLQTLPDDLADGMSHLLSVLQPPGALGSLPGVAAAVVSEETVVLGEVEQRLKPLVDWIENLTNKLDLTAIKEPLKSVADLTRSGVDNLDQGVASIILQVRSLFGQVESLLAQIEIQALVNSVKQAIQDFATKLTQQLQALFKPVQDAISQVVQSIGEGVDSFNPKDIIESLQQVIQSLTGVLKDPAVLSALADIRNAIDTVTKQLKQLSFTPVTDEVVRAIEEVTATLEKIDTSLLDNALKLALQAALVVLPESLTPLTNPIIEEFEQLIETGPVPLLDEVKQQPEKLLAKVKAFQPTALIGDALGKPYQNLLKQAEAFQPSHLLAPVQGELDKLKTRLQQDANPGAVIQPLEQPFEELLEAFARLKPETLIQPLEEAITTTIDTILNALPLDEVFSQIDSAFKDVADVIEFSQRLKTLLQKLQDLLAGFANSQSQVENWIEAILGKIEAMGDTSALQPRFADLTSALDETKAASLLSQFNGIVNPLLITLDTLNPQNRLTALIQAYGNFPQQVLADISNFPNEKAAINAVLSRFNPLDPVFSSPYQALATYQQTLSQSQSKLQETLANWDSRYHAPGGILGDFYVSTATPAQLRQWVEAALKPQFIQPFKAFFTLIEPLQHSLGPMLAILQNLTQTLQNKVSDLLLGPDSLTDIRNSLEELVQRLRDFNLDFLRDSLKAVFAQVRGKLTAIDPSKLRQAIEQAFAEMLTTLSLDQILPPTAVKQLDEDYGKVIAKLKELDPEKLVIKVIQPVFEEKILPLLAIFDLTELFTAVIDLLQSLDEELKAEMERVNQAYQKLRGAIPPISIDIDIDIDIDIGVSL